MGGARVSTIRRASSPPPGRSSADPARSELDGLHLDRPVEEIIGEMLVDVERLLDADIGLHQLIVALHPFGIEPAEGDRLRGLVAHELLDLLPVDKLVLDLEAGIRLD